MRGKLFGAKLQALTQFGSPYYIITCKTCRSSNQFSLGDCCNWISKTSQATPNRDFTTGFGSFRSIRYTILYNKNWKVSGFWGFKLKLRVLASFGGHLHLCVRLDWWATQRSIVVDLCACCCYFHKGHLPSNALQWTCPPLSAQHDWITSNVWSVGLEGEWDVLTDALIVKTS